MSIADQVAEAKQKLAEGAQQALKVEDPEEALVAPEGSEVRSLGESAVAAASIPIDILTKLAELDAYEPAKGDYRKLRLQAVILGNGTKVLPNKYGVYEVASLGVEAKEALEYYASNGVVEKVE